MTQIFVDIAYLQSKVIGGWSRNAHGELQQNPMTVRGSGTVFDLCRAVEICVNGEQNGLANQTTIKTRGE